MSNASKVREAVGRHYGTGELAHRIRQALQNAHSDTHPLNAAELAPIDQFHVGGLAATKEMAEALGLYAGATVLDIGWVRRICTIPRCNLPVSCNWHRSE
jgi:MPBQ/MSBQ methyltransferase